MIDAVSFCDALRDREINFVAGVPCSFFSGPISYLEQAGSGYVAAVNEGAALALAAGSELAGVRSAVLLQNSGFGNLINPLSSLVTTFDIAPVVFMSLRGWPDHHSDEPQHALMGRTSHQLLDLLEIPTWTLKPTQEDLSAALNLADRCRADGQTCFILVPKGTVGGHPAAADLATPIGPLFRRREAVAIVAERLTDELVFATTGYISRELSATGDRDLNFYMPGSMGHAASLGTGAALNVPDRRVVVLDGDGAALMHLGALATAGAYGPPNLIHIVLDNGAYESTGGQATTSACVDWAQVARAVGYRTALSCADAAQLRGALNACFARPGPHLIAASIHTDAAMVPPRVTDLGTPPQLRARFEMALQR